MIKGMLVKLRVGDGQEKWKGKLDFRSESHMDSANTERGRGRITRYFTSRLLKARGARHLA
jgi:hypothetical protein